MEGNVLVSELIESTTPRLRKFKEEAPQKQQNFDSFAVFTSNAQAVECAHLFAAGGAPFVAFVGPSGCGKSHILKATSHRMKSEFLSDVNVIDASCWALGRRRDGGSPLILDNVQEAVHQSRVNIQLGLALQRRVRSGRPTLLSFTAPKNSRTIKGFLPNSKDWVVCSVKPPEAAERQQLVKLWAKSEGLVLSESLAWLLSHRMKGNSPALLGALKRLRLYQSQWTDPSMTLRACGMLNMFFADDSGWDLREHLFVSANEYCHNHSQLCPKDLAIFALRRLGDISEVEVARFFEIEPAAAHAIAIQFETRVSNPENSCELSDVLGFLRFAIAKLVEA
jgi:energy-coupling factor transporter ATP-binding protein EcfA2